MKFALTSLIGVLAGIQSVHGICCLYGSLPDPCGKVAKSPLERGIYRRGVFVPEGARNVVDRDIDAICCCYAAEDECDTCVSFTVISAGPCN